MEFMSAAHVNAMNTLLADAPTVREECRRLSRPLVFAYRLSDGPTGATVHWTVSFDDTVRFSLDEHPQPDVVIVGDWADVIAATASGRYGEPREPDVSLEGDPEVLTLTSPALEAARAIATIDVEFPHV